MYYQTEWNQSDESFQTPMESPSREWPNTTTAATTICGYASCPDADCLGRRLHHLTPGPTNRAPPPVVVNNCTHHHNHKSTTTTTTTGVVGGSSSSPAAAHRPAPPPHLHLTPPSDKRNNRLETHSQPYHY